MRRGLGFAVIGIAFAGCGGGSSNRPADTTSSSSVPVGQDAPAKSDLPDSPERPPYLRKTQRAFRVTRRCSQGPFLLPARTLGADRGEDVEVYACGPRSFDGRYSYQRGNDDTPYEQEFRNYGVGGDHKRCLATAGELVSVGSGPAAATPSTTPAAGPATVVHGARTAPVTVDPTLLEEVAWSDTTVCRVRSHIMSYGIVTDERRPAQTAGLDIKVRIWSELPNDLEGVIFIIEQSAVDPAVTDAAWQAYRDASRAYWDKLPARYKLPDPPRLGPTTAPPPARVEIHPPRPSVHAEWIPGSWHWAGGSWNWMAGLWRVPDVDITAGATAEAPAPPPPVQVESQGRAIEGAVWTEGYWGWSGQWVWVPGAWRLPPAPTYGWRPAAWRPRASGVVFLPGGWTLRVGR